jgi:hypothetical protein
MLHVAILHGKLHVGVTAKARRGVRMVAALPSVNHQGFHVDITITRPAPGVAVIVIRGTDVGEFGDYAMRELGKDLQQFGSLALFIDARAVKSASIEVSREWARWMSLHREQFSRIAMLTGSRYIQITATFVRRFAGLVHQMQLFTEAAAFDQELAASVDEIKAHP